MVAGGLLVLTIAWALANPPSASPDEPANFVKAYATATGQLRGERYTSPARDRDDPRERWFRAAGRIYRIPPRLVAPPNIRCYAFDPAKTAACTTAPAPPRAEGDVVGGTQMGAYEPFLFAPAGLAARGGSSYVDALRRARLAGGLLCAAFFAAACVLAWDRGRRPLALAAVPIAVTPMVVFLSASVTTNGVEVASAVAWWVAMLAVIDRRDAGGARAPAAVLAVAGTVLALSRLLDPVFIAASVVVVVLAFGWAAARAAARRASVALALVAAGCAITLAWDVAVMPHPDTTLGAAGRALGPSWRAVGDQAREWVGVFGWLDTRLPGWAYPLGWALLGAPAAAALAGTARRWRQAGALILLAVGIVVADLAVATLIEAPIGYGTQGRYVLALAVGLPLLGGWLASGGLPPGAARMLTVLLGLGAAGLHLLGFVANARRYAVGVHGPWLPPWHAGWAPPGGTAMWLAVAAAGAALVGAGAVSGLWTSRQAALADAGRPG